MEIGKQIKKFRAEMEWSQDELAQKIFVSRQTISNWENDKNYPDVKSLLLLSSLFGVSLDILIKGDIEMMKEKIKTEDIKTLKHHGLILTALMVIMILSAVPLVKLCGYIGVGIWILITVVTILFALRVEKLKKSLDIQTYKEIVAFTEGKYLDDIEKNREYGKRTYQKIFLAIGAGLLTAAIVLTMICFVF